MTKPSPIDIIPKLLEPYFDDIECQSYDEHLANKFRGDKLTEHLIIRDCIDGDIGDDMDESYSYLFIIEDTDTHNLYAYDDCYIGSNAIPIIDLADMNIYEKGIADSTPAEHEYIPANSDDIFGYSSIDKRSVLMLPLIYRGMEHLQDAGIIK